MAEAFLEEIYQYADVASSLRHVVEYIRVHDDHHAVQKLNLLLPKVCEICKICVESGYAKGMLMWEQAQKLTAIQEDLILVGDHIEGAILPLVEEWLQKVAEISTEADEEFIIESCANGFLTIKNVRTNMYLHSKNDPMEEARKLVESGYEPEKSRYSVLGCGMGYHIYQLYKVSNGSVPITVYEENPAVVEYARNYGVLDWIPEERLKIVTGKITLLFLKSVDNQSTGILFHLPSIRQLTNEAEREAIMSVYIQQSTASKFKRNVQINFWRNSQQGLPDISKLRGLEKNEEMVVVAAGPSLDENMELLRSWQGQKTIVAVGTVFKKLLAAGIRPDYVAVMDPQERTLKQIDGVEKERVPMILDMASYWGFAADYQGPKYLVCTPGREKVIEDYAKTHQVEMWTGGGTVTSLALEFAIRFGAKKIYFIGVDLAYPEGVSHATGTMDYTVKNTENMIQIPGVFGKKVYADRPFMAYRAQIEERIAETKGIKYYNLSHVGAHIKGTIEVKDSATL